MVLKKKPHPTFSIPNYGKIARVKSRWRKQRGIDNKKRVKKNFAGAEPTIGYGTPEPLRHVRVSGKKAYLVHNIGELKSLMGNPDANDYEVMLAGALSKRKRMEIVKLARENKFNVTNG